MMSVPNRLSRAEYQYVLPEGRYRTRRSRRSLLTTDSPFAQFSASMMYCSVARGISGVNPASHTQAVTSVLAAGELEFDGQVSHVAAPGLGLKVPAPHDVHVPPSGPEEPALQVQAVAMRLPTGELEFDGQVLHVAVPRLGL